MKFKLTKVWKVRKWRWEWRWTLYAKNGKVIATSGSETYQNLQDCIDTIWSIKANAIKADVFVGKEQIIRKNGTETH